MNKNFEVTQEIEHIIKLALEEDLNELGDMTSKLILDNSKTSQATIRAKQDGIIAGLVVVREVFTKVDKELSVTNIVDEGAQIKSSDAIMKISGYIASILTAERTALNFLQRLSGIATLTSKFVEKVKGTGVKILDTRKTTPGLRVLEKHAVVAGGGQNHRMGLFDMVLIKENHITGAGGIAQAVNKIKANMRARNLNLKIEVEASASDQVEEACGLRVDRIMLDNMNLSQISEAVALVNGKVELEVSGGITLETVRDFAETGVDFISVGALTHSSKALDLSLLIDST